MNIETLSADKALNKSSGTCYQDTIETSYFNLINLFGLPTFGKGDKTLCEWVLQNHLGDVVTIYDWKSQTNDPELVSRWNLGGNGDTYSNVFLDKVMEKIKKGVDAENLVC
jgi:hypothetical protein